MSFNKALKLSSAILLASVVSGCASQGISAQKPEMQEQAQTQMPARMIGKVNVDQYTMAPLQYSRSAELSASPDRVWAFVANSKNLPLLLEPLESVTETANGSTRILKLKNGGSMTETIKQIDTAGKTLAYGVDQPNPFGITDHLGVIQVTPADQRSGSVLTWSLHFNHPEADNVRPNMIGVLDGAMVNAATRFGGLNDSGGDEGFKTATIRQSRKINAPKSKVWSVVADGYGQAHEWSSSIGEITITPSDSGGIIGEQRACFIPAFNGTTKETVTQYDERNGIFSYSVDEGKPPFTTKAVGTWIVKELSPTQSMVTVEIKMDVADGTPENVIGFTRSNFANVVTATIDEAKYFIERGEAHPRKTAALGVANQ